MTLAQAILSLTIPLRQIRLPLLTQYVVFCDRLAGTAGDLTRRLLQTANRTAGNVGPQILMGQMDFCSSCHRSDGEAAQGRE